MKVTAYQTPELDLKSRLRWLKNEVELLESWTDLKDTSEVMVRLDSISNMVYTLKETVHVR